ncbi:MAG: hypothetical protein DMG32_16490 [Acidobacteria bacterium]|nr:MAG: hypothetical protein DMG32_16490 [Acidobacteriota bacterium]
MPEFVPTNEPEASKRRSTRIVQAVPLTVIGVDALGRPFQERTSTLIINCHGCRYQSKHYVLKNMWVTLEVPHPEPGHPARSARARVMWIQRPRTVRELFQVGIELEVTGNFWGIAFPPSDWFPFPEGLAPVPSSPVTTISPASLAESTWTPSPVAPAEGNVRTLPLVPSLQQAPAIESSVAPQIARMLEEAKQGVQAALRQSAAEAVSLEARPLITSLELQLKSAAEKSLEAAAGPVAEKAFQQAKQLQVDAFLQECNRSMAESVTRTVQQLASRLEELEKERSAAFEQHLETRIGESLEQLQKQAADLRPQIPPESPSVETRGPQAPIQEVQELEQRVRAQIEQANRSLSEIESASRELRDQAASAFSSAQSDWKARVEADLSGAVDRWHQQIGSSAESAKQEFVERVARHAQSAGEHVERELALRIAEKSKTFADVANASEARLNLLRASLDQESERAQESVRSLQSIENQIDNQTAKIHGVARAVEQALEQRASALLEAQSQEMARRAEGAIIAWAERLQPALEATGQQTVTRLAAQIKAELKDRVESAAGMAARLESTIGSAEEALRSRQESLARASEHAIQSACDRVQDLVSALTRDFHESGRAAVERWISEIDAKATDTTHHAFESLFKTAEWYEKKVHTQMQAAIDKGMENALGTLKEKAREMSGIFGTELDHYSRSYVEHTQGQVEEAARESLERMRKQAEEMAAASAGSIVQQAREDTEAALADFRAQAASLSGQIKTRFEMHAAEARTISEGDSLRLSAEFQAALKLQVQEELGGARKELLTQLASAREQLGLESEAQQHKLGESVADLNDGAIEDYKRRLEAASSSWLLTTVSKLSQQSEQHVQALTKAAEERLRAACTEIFSGVGNALRRGLLDVDSLPPSPRKTDE